MQAHRGVRSRCTSLVAGVSLLISALIVPYSAQAAEETGSDSTPDTLAVVADTTLQSWQTEKTQSMAAKPYIGMLLPAGQGEFGERFVSADTSDGTDAKMGLLEFDLGGYREAPQSAKLQLTYVGFRGTKAATDTTTVKAMAVDTSVCTQGTSCAAATATWATRPHFTVDGESLVAESGAFAYGSVQYTGDAIQINPANTQQVEIDVTDIVKAQFAAGHTNITFAVQETNNTEVRFASSEGAAGALSGASADMAPKLRIVEKQPDFTLKVAPPQQITYRLGEHFDPAGLAVTLHETATGRDTALDQDSYTVDTSAFDSSNIGAYPITVRYANDPSVAGTFTVYVTAPVEDAGDGDTSGDDVLWYTTPARQTPRGSVGTGTLSGGTGSDNDIWQRTTLPIGNGKVGGTVWGEVSRERITFNEETLWTGGPGSQANYNGGNNASKGRDGATLRELNRQLENGAQTVNPSNLTGGENAAAQGAYQNWGNLYIDYGFDNSGEADSNASSSETAVSQYVRTLNLSRGLANVSFTRGGVDYMRQFFVSNPDNVMVARLTASGEKQLNFALTFPTNPGATKRGETITVEGDTLTVRGDLANNGLHYNAQVKAVLDDGVGTISRSKDGALRVSQANGVTLYIAAGTDYKNLYPAYRTGESADDLDARISSAVRDAANKGFDAVKADHVSDHSSYYDRVNIDLGQASHSDEGALPTDQLVEAYKAGTATEAQKRELEMLVYQYGRYLTIASSRENSQLPSNLQGIWSSTAGDNAHGTTPWGSDFHLNVNLQMNYWPTYSGNMAELAEPLIAYAESLVEPGRVTAKTYAGASTPGGTPIGEGAGYMAHTENTAYGWTTPGNEFSWGWSPAAMPWLLQNVYEAWEYSGDTQLLRERVYPLLKEEANFYVNYMLHKGNLPAADGSARLTTGVAYSPEHGPQGTDGNTYESTLVWQLLNDTIEAAQALGIDSELVAGDAPCSVNNWAKSDNGTFTQADANRSWSCALDLLQPIEVGTSGQIKEWFFEGEFGKKTDGSAIPGYQADHHHRHLSHLLGLFPGDLITVDNSTYMDAAEVSLVKRGDDATGWGVGQRLNAWARTGDGNHAYALIEKQLKNAMYPNLFDAHPPFQIDGNFGNTSGVNEMLLQSNSTFTADDATTYHNYMNLLPALPDAWAKQGSANGLRARGNFTVNMAWKDAQIDTLQITSHVGNTATLAFTGADSVKIRDVTLNQMVTPTVLDATHITFATTAGHVYEIGSDVALVEDPVVSVTPQEPTWDDGSRTYTINPVEGVIYTVNGNVVAGTITVPGTDDVKITVAASPAPGYVCADGVVLEWSHIFKASAGADHENMNQPGNQGQQGAQGEPGSQNQPSTGSPEQQSSNSQSANGVHMPKTGASFGLTALISLMFFCGGALALRARHGKCSR